MFRKSQTIIYVGDCREVLKTLPNESIHCVITSPPYFNLRDYGTAEWEGGDPKCNHLKGQLASMKSKLSGGKGVTAASKTSKTGMPFGDVCGKCGARRIDNQIGLESDYKTYVDEIVAVFREIRRVLRTDGTVWLNLGDSYAGGNNGGNRGKDGTKQKTNHGSLIKTSGLANGLKPKDLVGIPWRVAFALQNDGWYLRQDIIWSKPNCMPESVTDRCTKSHEYFFLLTKSQKYFFDADAIQEIGRIPGNVNPYGRGTDDPLLSNSGKGIFAAQQRAQMTRNKRSVWTIPTAAYHDAHFATFPPDLIQPCILAGTSANGCCEKCGAPWVRETKVTGGKSGQSWHNHEDDLVRGQRGGASGYKGKDRRDYESYSRETIGFKLSCNCNAPQIPCTILDPFAGTGTVAMVANKCGRDAVLIELNPKSVEMARKRLGGGSLVSKPPKIIDFGKR